MMSHALQLLLDWSFLVSGYLSGKYHTLFTTWSFSIMLYHPPSHTMSYAPILTHPWTNSFPMTMFSLCPCWFIHSHDPLHFLNDLSRIQLLTSKISHICQEICDIKCRRKPQSNLANQHYTSTGLDEVQTNQNYTPEQDSSNSAKEGSGGEDGWGGIYSSNSICQGHSCPTTSTEQLYMVQVSTTRWSTKTKDSNNYLDTNVWDRRSNR